LLVTVIVLTGCGGSSGAAGPSTPADGSLTGVTIERAASHTHRQGQIDYGGKKPPSGGDHNPVWLNCGAYSEQPPDEYAVHALEHGATWIAYGPNVPAADVAKLRGFAKQPKVLVTPYAGMAAPIVIVAWGHRLELQSASDPRVQQFIDAFGGGKSSPEPNGTCSGGVGQPDQV
jgi:hypothetical protein